MIRAIVLALLTTISVQGQDSTFVQEFCGVIGEPLNSSPESSLATLLEITKRYVERNPTIGDTSLQGRLRFHYRLGTELMRNCPNYPSDRVRLIAKPVIDLENQLTEQETDSLSALASRNENEKKVYVYIVTIDDYYPDSTITDFSNRYRDHWAPRRAPEKGVVLIVFSRINREIMISTDDVAMTYLTDDECSEVNKLMIPYFKVGKYFDGLAEGLLAIKSRL
jgi:hypothetical protein